MASCWHCGVNVTAAATGMQHVKASASNCASPEGYKLTFLSTLRSFLKFSLKILKSALSTFRDFIHKHRTSLCGQHDLGSIEL